jgi:hypothetical protein
MARSDGRRILFSINCMEAAEKIGGFQTIDDSLTPFYDGLILNPYGFEIFESDWFSFRVIKIKPYGNRPALVWQFYIEPTGDVILDHVEEFEGY